MKITGINDLNNYNKINSIRREIPQVNPTLDIQTDDGSVKLKEQQLPVKTDMETSAESRKLPDKEEVISFAVETGLSSDKDLIGSERDIRLLDVEKAISTMKRDSILQNYQYFVGNISTEDGTITRK